MISSTRTPNKLSKMEDVTRAAGSMSMLEYKSCSKAVEVSQFAGKDGTAVEGLLCSHLMYCCILSYMYVGS